MLPRLRDAAYDLVFVDADKTAYAVYYEQALRLLRPGGVVAFDNALWHDRVADPRQRDPETTVLRDLGSAVRDDDRLLSALLPVGDGLLVRRSQVSCYVDALQVLSGRRAALHRVLPPARRHPRGAARDGRRSSASRRSTSRTIRGAGTTTCPQHLRPRAIELGARELTMHEVGALLKRRKAESPIA